MQHRSWVSKRRGGSGQGLAFGGGGGNEMCILSESNEKAPLPGPGNHRFVGSGRPRGPWKRVQKVGAPPPFKRISRAPGEGQTTQIDHVRVREVGCFIGFTDYACEVSWSDFRWSLKPNRAVKPKRGRKPKRRVRPNGP